MIERVAEDSPERCQYIMKQGQGDQCRNKREPDSDYCKAHIAGHLRLANKKKAKMYNIGVYQQRLEEFSSHDAYRDLTNEIAIARMTLEKIIASCKTSNDLLAQSGKIGDMLMKVEKLVSSCNKLQKASGDLLEAQSVLDLASKIIVVIDEHVEDADTKGQIADKIMELLSASDQE